ncbi:MAG: hypothetical protein ATN36_07125 [Epulopiscium sp. Nele67-Bin005]|nr:MAG: hypothetical protein ATN36_07125 [Epulopiscium sp. Nele67-Bin005]
MTKQTQFVKGTLILAIGGLIAKVLGGVFKIPLTLMVGDVGVGYYGYAYPLYSLMTSLAIIGIPSSLAKILSQYQAAKKYDEIYIIFKYARNLMFIVGIILSTIIFVSTPYLVNLLGWEDDAKYCMFAIALCPVFICVMGAYRGYFQAFNNMSPIAISQFIENIIRVIAGLSLAYFLLPNIGLASGGATFGSVIGAMCGLVWLIIYGNKHIIKPTNIKANLNFIATSKTIFKFAIPIAIGSAMIAIISIIDAILVTQCLVNNGKSLEEATILFGQITKTNTLVNLPSTFGIAIVMNLIPTITHAIEARQSKLIEQKLNLALQLTFIIALPAMAGLITLALPIMEFVYQDHLMNMNILRISALTIPVMMISQVLSGILQGIGSIWTPVYALCIASIAKTILTYIFIGTNLEILGAPLASVISYTIIIIFNYYYIKKDTKINLAWFSLISKPLFTSIIMVIITHLTYINLTTSQALSTIISIGVGALVYGVLIIYFDKTLQQNLIQLKRENNNGKKSRRNART